MATIRMEVKVKDLGTNKAEIYDCLVENTADFSTDTKLTQGCGVGSMAYCIQDGKVYAKQSNGWGALE